MNKSSKNLIPRMALQSIRKNASVYLPYIGVCVFAMFTYFSFDLIMHNDVIMTIPRAAYALALMKVGFTLLSLIMIPFLFYTNSFLIKRRKKELGLYSILGMEKKHIGMLMLVETAVIYLVVMVASVSFGVLFSRLLFLLLLNLAKLPVQAHFSLSAAPLLDTLAFFGVVSLFNLSVNLYQVGKANPIELLSESKKGEKEPKGIWLWSILGVLALGAGYFIAVRMQVNTKVFNDLFMSVLLVIVGTYCLFTSGSILLLRFLKRRKKFYYKPENFVTVSGMLYRMKKSAAGLVNICIFSTMVILTAVCVVSLYLGIPGIHEFLNPFDVSVKMSQMEPDKQEEFLSQVEKLAEETNVTVDKKQYYSYVACSVGQKDNGLFAKNAYKEFANRGVLKLLTLEEYNRLEGSAEKVLLSDNEVLLFTTGPDFLTSENKAASVRFGELLFTVKEELQESAIAPKAQNNTYLYNYAAVVKDEAVLSQIAGEYGENGDKKFLLELTPEGEEAAIKEFVQKLETLSRGNAAFLEYRDNTNVKQDTESMYGGLLFIGIFFALIFAVCLLVILYYKQITEGFEDRSSFEIMQKVGMSDREVKGTIRRQILLVFFLPLIGALCHAAVCMHLVIIMFATLSMFQTKLIMLCTVGVSIVFAIIYILCYRRTAKTYYKIVRWE